MDESIDSTPYTDLDQVPIRVARGSNTGKWLSILSLLKNGTHTEQVMALTELSNLLSYSNEEYLLGFPSLSYIKVLFHILENPDVKYCKRFPKNSDKSPESKDSSLNFQLPYFQFLSSVYKDDKILMDKIYSDKFLEEPEKKESEEDKEEESDAGMDIDEDEFFEGNSEVFTNKMILSATCLNTILDIVPYMSRYFAMNDNLCTLCKKLNDLEYIDLAERILLIFEKLSHEIPFNLLEKSVLSHILQYIDFFPIDIQISTFNCVLNVVKLVDTKEHFNQHVLPILSTLSTFLNNDNKKLVDILLSIWKELLSIVLRCGNDELVSEFVCKLAENNFLEKILKLILSPNMGRTAILEHVSILSSLVQLSTEMVKQLFQYDQLENIKSLCYNQNDSLQYLFIQLANNILSNPSTGELSKEEDEFSDVGEDVEMEHNEAVKRDQLVLQNYDRDLFFCENQNYFSVLFELFPISDLCDLCFQFSSDKNKFSVIGLIYNLLRIGNKIEHFNHAIQTTLSVSKSVELVSTCLLQLDFNSEGTLSNLLGILRELVNIFGNNVILTFQRYGIDEYFKKLQFENPYNTMLLHANNDLLQLIINTPNPGQQAQQVPSESHDESDLLFEIRTNFDVWTPYELVRNVPLSRLSFFDDKETLDKFITILFNQSFTATHLQILWKAFLKILQYASLYNITSLPTTPKMVVSNPEQDPCLSKTSDNSVSKDNSVNRTEKEERLTDRLLREVENLAKGLDKSENVQLLGSLDKRSKGSLERVLRKYVNSYPSHPFNILHNDLKLRLKPINSNRTQKSPSKLGCLVDESNTGIVQGEDKLLPISVYVPCLVRLSRVESYVRRYVERKTNMKVSELYLYLNGVSLGPNVVVYEALCRFGDFAPNKRKQIVNQSHVIKYNYKLHPDSSSDKNDNFSSSPNGKTVSLDKGNSTSPTATSLSYKFFPSTLDSSFSLLNSNQPTNSDHTHSEEEMEIYTLYKGGKYNFHSLVKDFKRYVHHGDGNGYEGDKEEVIRDDSTIANTVRFCEDLRYENTVRESDQGNSGYFDKNELLEMFNQKNNIEDYYIQSTNEYIKNLSSESISSVSVEEGGNSGNFVQDVGMNTNRIDPTDVGSLEPLGYEKEQFNNPIIYTELPIQTMSKEVTNDCLNYLLSLTQFDQERINFILGQKNEFNDFILEAAFPKFQNLVSKDKVVVLRILSIFFNLIQTLNCEEQEFNTFYPDANDVNLVASTTTDDQYDPFGLLVSNHLSLKLLSACSDLGSSLCFGSDYWVIFALICPSIFSLKSRTVLFRMNTVGLHRNLSEYYTRLKNLSNDTTTDPFDDYLLEHVGNNRLKLVDEEVKVPKMKFVIDRENFFEGAMSNFERVHNNPKLEIEYKNEVGIGSGPTLEFFTLISETFANFDKPRILDYKDGYYFPTPHSMLNSDLSKVFNSHAKELKLNDYGDKDLPLLLFKLFSLLGKVCAYAMMDDKMFDLFFHPTFWNLVKYPNKPQNLNLDSLRQVDPELASSLQKIKDHPDPAQLHLTHEYQGYELFKGGSNVYVNCDNAEEYVQMIVNFKLLYGIKLQIWAFRYGFSSVLPLYSLWFFNDHELSEVIFGNMKNQNQFWTVEHLKSYIIPDHGYDSNSPVYNNLITILSQFDENTRRLFLKFATGAPILPREGFKSLVPLMRVVKKGNVNELPSVMTCTNYLKMPNYSTIEEMNEKLFKAIKEGQNSFNLS